MVCCGGRHGLDLAGEAYHLAEICTRGRLAFEQGKLHTGFFQQAHIAQGRLGQDGIGHLTEIQEHLSSVWTGAGLLPNAGAAAEDVAAAVKGVHRFEHGGRGDVLDHGKGAGLAYEVAGLVARGAVIGAGVAESAVVHCLGNIGVVFDTALYQRDEQAPCPRRPALVARTAGDRTYVPAHPAESAGFCLSGTFFRKHIMTSL